MHRGRIQDGLTGLEVPAEGQRCELRTGGAGMRQSKVICAFATGHHRNLLALGAKCIEAYAFRHGWDVVLSCEQLSQGRPASWAKVPLMQRLLDEHDFVLCLDADAIIVDLDRSILPEVDDRADIWLAHHPQQ